MDYIWSQYTELMHLNINTDVIRDLYKEQVITLNEKKEIQRKEMEKRMEYFLDDIIIPSLEAKSSQKYIGLVRVMNRSDDSVLKDVASKLALNLHSWLVIIHTYCITVSASYSHTCYAVHNFIIIH